MKLKTNHIIYVFLLIITMLLPNIVYSQTIEEVTFEELSYSNWVIEKDQNICKTYNITDLENNDNSKLVLQLLIDNYIPSKNVKYTIYLNDSKEKTIIGEEINKKNIIILNNKKETNNNLKICVENNFLPKIIISNESKIGEYLLAEIKEENFYQKLPDFVRNDELAAIEVIVKNTGFAPIDVEVDNAKLEYIQNSNLSNVSGDTHYLGPIYPNETINLKYYIKTNKSTKFISPRAYLKYTDEFGVVKELLTKPKVIEVDEKQIFLDTYIEIPTNNVIKENNKGTLILRNKSNKKLENIIINPRFTGGIIDLDISEKINLDPKDVKEYTFYIKSHKKGEYELNFSINYLVDSQEKTLSSSTKKIFFDYKEDNTSKLIGAFILLSIIIFIWKIKTK